MHEAHACRPASRACLHAPVFQRGPNIPRVTYTPSSLHARLQIYVQGRCTSSVHHAQLLSLSLTSAQLVPGDSETSKQEPDSATLGEVRPTSCCFCYFAGFGSSPGACLRKVPPPSSPRQRRLAPETKHLRRWGSRPPLIQPGSKTQALWRAPGVLACWRSCCCARKSPRGGSMKEIGFPAVFYRHWLGGWPHRPPLPNQGAYALPRSYHHSTGEY